MQLQFNKTVIPCLHTVKRELQTQEQTQEVRLTDDMPDIGKVLAGWGQLVVRGKEWRSGSAGVSGGVMIWVMYLPENGEDIQCVETWLPFQMKWDIPNTQHDGSIHVIPYLRGVDARSLSARKLMIRAGIDMLAQIMIPGEVETFTPDIIPDDVQVLRNSYPIQIPVEAGEKAFLIEETLRLHQLNRLFADCCVYDMQPKVMESRVIGDKLVVRGMAMLVVLYKCTENRLHRYEFEIPFSQYAELDNEYGADAEAAIHMALTALELDGEEENLRLKAGLTAQYVIWSRTVVETLEDMYSPFRQLKVKRTELEMPALLNCWVESVPLDRCVDADGVEILDTVFYTEHPQIRCMNGEMVAELSGIYQTLGYNREGIPQVVLSRWETDCAIHSSEEERMDLTAQISGNEITMDIQSFGQKGMPMVVSAEAAEDAVKDPSRPSLVLQRAGSDSLWQIAKKTGSTIGAIEKANNLQQEPNAEQMLIIPIL